MPTLPDCSTVKRLLVDSHLDLAWNAIQWNRDLTQSVTRIRLSEKDMPGKGRAEGTVALPELAQAGVGVAFVTTLARCTGHHVQHLDFAHPAQAFASARGHLAYYQALARTGWGVVIDSPEILDKHLQAWQAWQLQPDHKPYPGLGMALSMESADPILDPAELGEWVAAGVWLIGPSHYGNGRYCGGTSCETGFTEQGFLLLDEMAELGVTLDVTHLSERAFHEALDRYPGYMVASHHNCRHLVEHDRQLDDGQIRALCERDAVIGIALDAWMLQPGWVKGKSSNADVSLAHAVDHIEHICELTGTVAHVGIGSDLDGGFGKSQSPGDLESIADLPRLADLLAARGYADKDIDAIFHGNWLRKLRQGLQQRSKQQ